MESASDVDSVVSNFLSFVFDGTMNLDFALQTGYKPLEERIALLGIFNETLALQAEISNRTPTEGEEHRANLINNNFGREVVPRAILLYFSKTIDNTMSNKQPFRLDPRDMK